jgi:hypothetical protein
MAAKRIKTKSYEPGYDGAITIVANVRVTSTRSDQRSLRCRPGTFEWRYGRATADSSLYHAGIKFADLWERAGTASASSPDFAASGGGQWKGIPDGRVIAMSEIDAARRDIGKWGTARLVDYCVMGSPSSDIARKYNTDERAMAAVLFEDLRACAVHFGYL